jgi:hypothetical protein
MIAAIAGAVAPAVGNAGGGRETALAPALLR